MTVSVMTVQELTKKIIGQEELFILDVRNKKEFEEWKIEGKNFRHMNIPYFELLDGVENILNQIPRDQNVLVVCAKEGSSVMVADMLSEKGRDVYYLKGGMKAYSEHLEPVKVGDLPAGGKIYQFVRIGKGCLSYMIVSGGEAAVVDPTRMIDVFIDFAESIGAKITHVLDTHLHADHISGGRTLAERVKADYWLPPKDAKEVTFSYRPLIDGDRIRIGDTEIEIEAFYTPGHTIGSTSFIVGQKYLMTGDLLFVDSIGRPDLAGKAEEWVDDLRETLYDRYKQLPGDYIVLPAHFMIVDELNDDGTVAEKLSVLYEKNHGLQIEREEDFRRLVTVSLPPQPNSYREIRQANMGKLSPDEEEQREMEIGPNRCAVR